MKRLLTCLYLALATAPSAAEEWGSTGLWKILLRDGPVNTCYAMRQLPDESIVEIGFARERGRGYFAIYNAAWTHLEDGRKGVVEFDFGNARFAGETVGRIENGFPGGYAAFNNPAFVDAFARGRSVKIIGTEGAEFELDLTGTHRAIAEIRTCAAAQGDRPKQ
ncbi:MAG: hypothetical protein AAGA38_05500 [Pseudomonadota bacterium]